MESLLLPIINYISQSFPEIPYVYEDYRQLEVIDNEEARRDSAQRAFVSVARRVQARVTGWSASDIYALAQKSRD